MSKEAMKKAAGYKAAELIQNGMQIGLGTGSTVFYFIERLISRCKEGLQIRAIASSKHSYDLAKKGGVPLLDIETITHLDLTVDGADEIDAKKRLIKGGGGALVREKIVAAMSKELIIIIDETKRVFALGKCKLPVEVIPFAKQATLHHIKKAGYTGHFRTQEDKTLYITDNGNYILDIHFENLRDTPEKDHEKLLHIPGVVDTGFFFNLTGRVITGFADGQVVVN